MALLGAVVEAWRCTNLRKKQVGLGGEIIMLYVGEHRLPPRATSPFTTNQRQNSKFHGRTGTVRVCLASSNAMRTHTVDNASYRRLRILPWDLCRGSGCRRHRYPRQSCLLPEGGWVPRPRCRDMAIYISLKRRPPECVSLVFAMFGLGATTALPSSLHISEEVLNGRSQCLRPFDPPGLLRTGMLW